MSEKKELVWEQIDNQHKRAKVLGGWLVRTREPVRSWIGGERWDFGYEWTVAICFVPDQLHKWAL